MADLKKTFAQDWAGNTMTGRLADMVTGGAISGAADRVAADAARQQRPTREYKRDGEGKFSKGGVELSDVQKMYGKKGKR